MTYVFIIFTAVIVFRGFSFAVFNFKQKSKRAGVGAVLLQLFVLASLTAYIIIKLIL